MKNKLTCPTCGFDNDFYSRICTSCKGYLRDRVVNIDLWSVISLLIEIPTKAFRNIIQAEHKNFILFLLIAISIKYLITARLLAGNTLGNFTPSTNIFLSYLIILTAIFLLFILFSLLVKLLLRNFEFNTRFKDNLAITIYSQVPLIFSLIILFPLEIVIFGDYLFSTNPTPFQIKPALAYIFFVVEIIAFLWSTFLLFVSLFVSSNSKAISILTTAIFVLLISTVVIYTSKIIFTL